MTSKSSPQELAKNMERSTLPERKKAIIRIAQLGEQKARPYLLALWQHEKPHVRAIGNQALHKLIEVSRVRAKIRTIAAVRAREKSQEPSASRRSALHLPRSRLR